MKILFRKSWGLLPNFKPVSWLTISLLCLALSPASAWAQTPVPLPPDPGRQGTSAPRAPVPRPPGSNAGKLPEPCAGVPQLSTAEVVQKVNGYFNGFTYLNADFIQFNADGRRFKGQMFVHRPGRLRFDYDPPSPLEIISDGSTVVLRNRKLATQDVYGIGQTPLKFLLKEKLDLNIDAKIIRGSRECDLISLIFEDKSTVAGTSRIRLVISAEPMILKQWTISDPNGSDTTIQVSNLDTARRPDSKLFTIDTTRYLDPK